MKFCERLKELRKTKNMTQEELSLKMRVSPAAIGLYEQGRRKPDNDTLIKLASIFNVSIDYLLGIEDCYYNGNDDLKKEIAELTTKILESTDNPDTLTILKNMLSGICGK